MSDALFSWIAWINSYLWSPWTFFLLMVSGIAFSIWTKMIQFRSLTHGFRVLRGDYDKPGDPGSITPFQALSASLSGTVGLGNIGGVALAITAGGPGALFWMWVIGFLGMALKTVEITQALMYRNTANPTDPQGGAMWVIDKTLGNHGGLRRIGAKALGVFFSLALVVSTITGGNMFQAWNVGALTEGYFEVPRLWTGLLLAFFVGLVIVGGVRRIGSVASRLVPIMCAFYLVAALAVLVNHIHEIPGFFAEIFRGAFSRSQAGGAFLGGTVGWGFSVGLRRALFSNEAGQGSGPIAHAAARTSEPARQGLLGGLGPFIDTICVCTLTALVILASGLWNRQPIGELRGAVRVTQYGISSAAPVSIWEVDAPTRVSALPELADGSWTVGNRLFLMARVEGALHRDTGADHVRVTGTVVDGADHPATAAPAGEAVGIQWDPVELNLEEWRGEIRGVSLIDQGVYRSFDGAELTAQALDQEFPGLGKWLVSIAAWLFAISTIITWSYYGEQGMIYLIGRAGVLPYRLIYIAMVVVGTVLITDTRDMEAFMDIGTGGMLWANMPIVLMLGNRAVTQLNGYLKRLDAGEFERQE
jgi:AGCS family alanine or glycine:cation symporter